MKTAVIALTKNGSKLAIEIASKLIADAYVKEEFVDSYVGRVMPLSENSFTLFIGSIFDKYDAFVFIMACGIVVRSVAPYIKDKKTDPAVVVMDEMGRHVISLLSGHMGGANRLATKIATITDGEPVITTSTDVNETIAFDVFAKENDCAIENIQDLKYISSQLVNGGKVGLHSDYGINGKLPQSIVCDVSDVKYAVVLSNRTGIEIDAERVIYIRPRNLILGIGCKRGTTADQIHEAVEDFLQRNNRSKLSIKCVATVDVKKDEAGLIEFCSRNSLDLRIILRDDIQKVEDRFTYSDFVKSSVGVGSVAEPCAVLAGINASLICGKTPYNGITLALAEETREFYV